ncbi:MAG: N-acetyl-gamma-glutamyl-phosphate reductase, partial [Frankiales bacterium]|nr:N-acetyl-gamma-glutamyl-phosphate reductase [Frankiales bacterium]
MGITAAVAGASGYAGGELLRLLLAHPELEVGPVAAGSATGRPVTDLHPHLPQL